MKRFMLFYGESYYPSGGMEDFVNSYDSLQEAIDFIELKEQENTDIINESRKMSPSYRKDKDYIKWSGNWAHIWDIQENKEVWCSYK